MSNNNNIPVFKHEQQHINKSEHLIHENVWIEDNLDEIIRLWECTRNYIKDNNLTFLDKCKFDIFLNFVVKFSTHYRTYYDTSSEES